MKIQELFLKPVERPIDGVIKADDQRNLRTELEEYVVTRDVMRGLGEFTDRYLGELTANGVWISGFFGSGKSHLLKMLSHLLDPTPLADGLRPAEVLLPKVEDEIIRADLQRVVKIPSRSLLFNIDQKFDGIGGNHQAPILEVFVKVLNELQGYYGKQGYIARFERQLDERGELQPFRGTYQRVTGNAWEEDRDAILTVCREEFGRAYAEHFGGSEDQGMQLIQQVREDYRVSIEDLAHMVKGYIDQQPPGFRLNFFIDEIGQFIGQDSGRMLNLQTVAETLGTVCEGRAWVFVTSQADLDGVLGELHGMRANDITKIQGRFRTRVTLASADVREVIQKRLLAKTEAEPEVLTDIWDREKDNLQTLYRFGDGSRTYGGWRGSDEFCALYPFHPYQFDLFQEAITQLSRHDAFTGRYVAVGERSMLAVFQEVAKSVRAERVGRLATFDRMYDGIAASLRGDMQTTVRLAENRLGDGLPVRILKALFLLKWVREFKATPRNVAILLVERPDVDIRAHEQAVKEALALLEADSYLQRHGDTYEFLTDAEKDIEVEIKSTEVEDSAIADLLQKTLFADVLRDPKIRYEGNQQDYTYARKLDDALMGRDADVSLHVVTPEHPNHADPSVLAMQTMGRAELLAVLPADTRLNDLARLYLKTDRYIRQNSGTPDESRKSILEQRGRQNSERRKEMVELASEFLSRAPLYLNGSRLDTVGQGEPRNRYAKAFQELIAFAYPKLKMLKGSYDEGSLTRALTERDDLFGGDGQPLSEAEQELLTYVRRNQDDGQRTSIEEMVRHFGRRPYGWYPMAVLTLVARLFRMGKVELRAGELLDARGALDHLRSSRQHGGVRVRLQEQFDAAKVNALKVFHHDFFDRANDGTEASSVGKATADAFAARALALTPLVDQSRRYPFLEPIRPVVQRLEKLAAQDHAWLLNHLAEYQDELLGQKDDLIGPIEQFMHGQQRLAYDEALAFLREEAANLAELPPEDLEPLRALEQSANPYRGTAVPSARTAMAKLRERLSGLLDSERAEALATLDEHEGRLRTLPDFAALDDERRARVLAVSAGTRADVAAARFVTGIRDRVQRYVGREYPAQLALLAQLATPPAPGPVVTGTTGGGGTPPTPAPIHYVPASSLRPRCALPYVATSDELAQWLDALRAAAEAELAKGRRISL